MKKAALRPRREAEGRPGAVPRRARTSKSCSRRHPDETVRSTAPEFPRSCRAPTSPIRSSRLQADELRRAYGGRLLEEDAHPDYGVASHAEGLDEHLRIPREIRKRDHRRSAASSPSSRHDDIGRASSSAPQGGASGRSWRTSGARNARGRIRPRIPPHIARLECVGSAAHRLYRQSLFSPIDIEGRNTSLNP